VDQISEGKECSVVLSVLFLCFVVVAILPVATDMICLHDVSQIFTRVGSVHRGEGGAPGQHTWHT
jgi:hypothetical protein